MSALGHERPIDGGLDESAYPPIATVSLHCRKLRSWPMSDIRSSLDHLIGGVQEFVRDAEAERLGGPSDETRARAEIPGPSCASCSPKRRSWRRMLSSRSHRRQSRHQALSRCSCGTACSARVPPCRREIRSFAGGPSVKFPRTKLKGWRKNFSIYLPSSAIRERFGLLVGKIGV